MALLFCAIFITKLCYIINLILGIIGNFYHERPLVYLAQYYITRIG